MTNIVLARGAALARAFAQGKLVNQARLLRYLAKNRRESMPRAHQGAGSAALLIEGLASGTEIDLRGQLHHLASSLVARS